MKQINRQGCDLLTIYSENKHPELDVIKFLVACGLNTNGIKSGKYCVLANFINNKCGVEVIDVLLEAGLNVNSVNRKGDSILMQLKRFDIIVIKRLIELGLDASYVNPRNGRNVLFNEFLKSEEILIFLMNSGANINQVNSNGDTPLLNLI